jgi:peroxiredoxin
LTPRQQAAWKDAIGRPFDLGTLGQPALAAPEIVDSGAWINSPEPLTLAGLRGKVVVVHFYAANCINCIRNFPTYRLWQERFAAKDVVLLGIHTPETAEERDAAAVRRKAADEKLTFPICIDGKNANWNAWGNSMWPSVYVIDKRGYVRHSWHGELKWQGATGDEFLAGRIDALVAE